jgi:hypothetical protein
LWLTRENPRGGLRNIKSILTLDSENCLKDAHTGFLTNKEYDIFELRILARSRVTAVICRTLRFSLKLISL